MLSKFNLYRYNLGEEEEGEDGDDTSSTSSSYSSGSVTGGALHVESS